MRRGCIAIGEFTCDNCGRTIEHGERYLLDSEEDEDSKQHFCIDCCLNKKLAGYVTEKGESVLSFFV